MLVHDSVHALLVFVHSQFGLSFQKADMSKNRISIGTSSVVIIIIIIIIIIITVVVAFVAVVVITECINTD